MLLYCDDFSLFMVCKVNFFGFGYLCSIVHPHAISMFVLIHLYLSSVTPCCKYSSETCLWFPTLVGNSPKWNIGSNMGTCDLSDLNSGLQSSYLLFVVML